MYATRADGTGTPAKVTPDEAAEWHARVSPDGKLVAFISDRDREAGDEGDVFVRELTRRPRPPVDAAHAWWRRRALSGVGARQRARVVHRQSRREKARRSG